MDLYFRCKKLTGAITITLVCLILTKYKATCTRILDGYQAYLDESFSQLVDLGLRCQDFAISILILFLPVTFGEVIAFW